MAEEIVVDAPHDDRVVALLNDDSTEVGRVHLGIVHCWTLKSPAVRKREQVITQMSFVSREELRAVSDSLESWSRFCLERFDELLPLAAN